MHCAPGLYFRTFCIIFQFFVLGSTKNNEMYKPLTVNAEGSASFSLTFLHQATEIFKKWKASGQSGLTNKTFTACIQSMEAVSQIGFSPNFQTWVQQAMCFLENLPAIQLKNVLASTARLMAVIFECQLCNFFNQKKKKNRCLSLLRQKALPNLASLNTSQEQH